MSGCSWATAAAGSWASRGTVDAVMRGRSARSTVGRVMKVIEGYHARGREFVLVEGVV